MAAALRTSLRSLWALPCTLLGLLLAVALAVPARGLRLRRLGGVWECTLRRGHAEGLGHLPFDAIALGELILARDDAVLNALRSHERVHVEQARRWGPLFLLAYPLASLLCWLRGQRAYWDNPFEREAREAQ